MIDKEIMNLLESLLKRELEYLRKRFRPYKRRPFLNNKVTIDIKDGDKNVLGLYENTKKDKRDYKYTHIIYITNTSINDYKRYYKWRMKRCAINRLRDTIRHELIHAFVFEEFEEWETIENCYGDYSPIFLGCLYWANGYSGHPFTNAFYKTDLFNKIKDCKKYDIVYIHLLNYIYSLERTVSKINKDILPEKELKISFNFYGSGIIKKAYLKQSVISIKDNKKIEHSAELLKLGIGFLVDSNKLLESYNDKFTNGILAQHHEEQKNYILNDNILNKVTLVSNIK